MGDDQRRRAFTYPGMLDSDPVALWKIEYVDYKRKPGVVTLKNKKTSEFLFTGIKAKDYWRRYVATWIPRGWNAKKDTKCQWKMTVYSGRAAVASVNATGFDVLDIVDANTTALRVGGEPLTNESERIFFP